ncbi:SRPBCC family protein [Pimelobacter simplex]|uniref:SRPBCC family protein n=1 Tax=Nocardioides simplex TaxID=2045 RepID=UPI0019334033|nr:SRPBCC family protein [Pimelobacter simplex]
MKTTSLTRHLDVEPDAALRMIIDVHALPSWNAAITRILDAPATLMVGDEWVVEMSALGQTWSSRSRLIALDRDARRFSYRSATDDGNPSYAEWTWTVTEAPGGCEVTVTWTLNPQTFWRQVLLGRIRQRQLAQIEVPTSLAALKAAVEAAGSRG